MKIGPGYEKYEFFVLLEKILAAEMSVIAEDLRTSSKKNQGTEVFGRNFLIVFFPHRYNRRFVCVYMMKLNIPQ